MAQYYMSYKAFFQQLRAMRKQAGIKTAQIITKTGWSRQRISQLERGEVDAQLSTLIALANAVGAELILVPKDLASLTRSFIASGGTLAPQAGKTGVEFLLAQSRS